MGLDREYERQVKERQAQKRACVTIGRIFNETGKMPDNSEIADILKKERAKVEES